MTFKNTNKDDIGINKKSLFNLQPTIGLTGYRQPINSGDFNEHRPNESYPVQGYTAQFPANYFTPMSEFPYPRLPIAEIRTDRKKFAYLICFPFVSNVNYLKRFKPGDQIQLERQNIKRSFTIKKIKRHSTSIDSKTWAQWAKYFQGMWDDCNSIQRPIRDNIRELEKEIPSKLTQIENYHLIISGIESKIEIETDPVIIEDLKSQLAYYNLLLESSNETYEDLVIEYNLYSNQYEMAIMNCNQIHYVLEVAEYYSGNPHAKFDDSSTPIEIHLLNDRDYETEKFEELDHFITGSGYFGEQVLNSYSWNGYGGLVNFSRKLEQNSTSNLKSFSVDFNKYEYSDSYSIKASWEIDGKVSASLLRWRSVPNNLKLGDISYSISGTTRFSGSAPVTITSDTGSGATIKLRGNVIQYVIDNPGSGYTHATAVLSGGEGTGASASIVLTLGTVYSISPSSYGTGYEYPPTVKIVGDGSGASAHALVLMDTVEITNIGGGYLRPPDVSIDFSNAETTTNTVVTSSLNLKTDGRLDYIKVLNGGTGFTGASVTVSPSYGIAPIPGLYEFGATAYGYAEIEEGSIKNIILTDPGYGFSYKYLTAPQPTIIITPSGTGGSGASLRANIDTASEWNYELPVYKSKSAIISGLKLGIEYEIELLASPDENFRGLNHYSDPIKFRYSKNL